MSPFALIRLALSLPPRLVLKKAAGLARRRLGLAGRRLLDYAGGSHEPPPPETPFPARLRLDPAAIPPDLVATLRVIAPLLLEHRFDLLGSGRVRCAYGVTAAGLCGHRYPPGPAVVADPEGLWLKGRINRANLAGSRRLWALLAEQAPDYRPIDWQLDFKSGFRWREGRFFTEQPVPVDRGADIKLPWELARLQHLPQLALCALLARAGSPGFAAPARYQGEVRAQILDFLACNPPRFGVNWVCPMDIGIRIANLLLAVDLLTGAGLPFDPPFVAAVLAAARSHGFHIAAHLEWSETGRSNHYLADLAGMLWAAAYLPAERRSDALLALACRELTGELDHQFHRDGGSYEGSTNYHRLSAELGVFGIALILGLEPERRAAFRHYDRHALTVRPPVPPPPLPVHDHGAGNGTIVPPEVWRKLVGAAGLCAAATRPDGLAVQIGDTDSGRLFKLHPVALPGADAAGFIEHDLDYRGLTDAVAVLSGAPFRPEEHRLEAALAAALARNRHLPALVPAPLPDSGDLEHEIAVIAALPEPCRRRRVLALPPLPPEAPARRWHRSGFPEFGLYVFKAPDAFIAFRCRPPPPAAAPSGHEHDDALGLEYDFGPAGRCHDPGTFLYTPSRAERNRYRAAAAHDVPRFEGAEVAPAGESLFTLHRRGRAQLLAWRDDGVAGAVQTPEGTIRRAVLIGRDTVTIWDGVEPPGRLRPPAPPPEYCVGYGRKSENPAGAV